MCNRVLLSPDRTGLLEKAMPMFSEWSDRDTVGRVVVGCWMMYGSPVADLGDPVRLATSLPRR